MQVTTIVSKSPCRLQKLNLPEKERMKSDYSKAARKLLENCSNFQLDGLALQGLRIDCVEIDLIRCKFVIPDHLSDGAGNWNVGAMSVLIDDIAACAVFAYCGRNLVTMDFSISCCSTAKINEEVEIEAIVAGHKGNLVLVAIDIKKKTYGEKVVVGRQWMNTTPIKSSQAGKSKL